MADEVPVGMKIREFLRQVFGSRLNAHLEIELAQLRQDFEARLQERDQRCAELQSDIERLRGKVAEYELVLIPLTSGIRLGGNPTPPSFSDPIIERSSWQATLAEHLAKQQAEEVEEPQ